MSNSVKFSIATDSIASAIKMVAGVVPSRTTIPLLGHMRISATKETDDGQLAFFGTSIDQQLSFVVPAGIESPGTFAIHAATLDGIMSALPKDGVIKFNVNEDGAKISCGRSKYTVRVMDDADIPIMAEDDGSSVIIDGSTLALALSSVIEACEATDHRGLAGIRLHKNASGKLVAVGTDGLRLMRYEFPSLPGIEDLPPVTIPSEAASRMIGILKSMDGDVTLFAGKTTIGISTGSISYVARLGSQSYPRYESLIPKIKKSSMSIERDIFYGAIKRAMAVSASSVNLEKAAPTLNFSAKPDGALVLKSGRHGSGTFSEEADAEISEDIGFTCSTRFMMAAMARWPEGSVVEIHANGADKPILITSPSQENLLHLIMPVTKGDISHDDRTSESDDRSGISASA